MQNKERELKKIKGRRIRPLFFNYFMYSMFLVFIITDGYSLIEFIKSRTYNLKLATEVLEITILFLVLIGVVNRLNRWLIGPLTAVMNQEGIYGKDFMVPWDQITKVTFDIHGYGKRTNELGIYRNRTKYVIRYASLWDIGYVKRRAKNAHCVSLYYCVVCLTMILYVALAIQVVITSVLCK